MRISDWSSYVCSSDLKRHSAAAILAHLEPDIAGRVELDRAGLPSGPAEPALGHAARELGADSIRGFAVRPADPGVPGEQGLQGHAPQLSGTPHLSLARSEEHTSELKSLMRISSAV